MSYYNFKAQGTGGPTAFYLGTLAHGSTMNVAAKYDGYANLTSANFVVVPQSNSISSTKTNYNDVDVAGWREAREDTNSASYSAPSINYNASTGQLSFSSTVSCGGNSFGYDVDNYNFRWGQTYPSASRGLTAKIYLLTEVQNL